MQTLTKIRKFRDHMENEWSNGRGDWNMGEMIRQYNDFFSDELIKDVEPKIPSFSDLLTEKSNERNGSKALQ